MNIKIVTAIHDKRVLEITYKDEVRLIEPHAFGLNGKLRAYQTSPEEGWRLFDAAKIATCTITNNQFSGPRPLYNPDDKAMPEGFHARLAA